MKKSLLKVRNLNVSVGDKEILHGVSLDVGKGEMVVVMGPNGSGKSTLTSAIMGNPQYSVTGEIGFEGAEMSGLPTEERSRKGLFLAFQSPIAVPGVSVVNLLRTAVTGRKTAGQPEPTALEILGKVKESAKFLHMDESFLARGVNDGFSGGERKKTEVLQALVLQPKLAMFDEIDTGLDVDALRIVAAGISKLRDQGVAVLVITHYNRILRYLIPDRVIVLSGGNVIESGDRKLAERIESEGYALIGN